ncbi:ATP-binding cassette sub-family G member 1-like [Armigeres subalbatus]|uniref:ATP-binding cassette sub-family G member 1-like n=1 Tax=Armigeres subalbatus TaxID=124917 RepID=UPI002ED0A7AB
MTLTSQSPLTEMVTNDATEVAIPLMDVSSTVLSFENLNYSVQQGSKRILQDVSGLFRSGRLAAIIGPSGAGKSSLLNVLSGFQVQGMEGRILVNNESVDRERYRQMVAYNPQEVMLLPTITVTETLLYAVDLRMSSSVSRFQKIKIVNDIIALLGLEECAHRQARVLSGGEKKRLSIGQELVSNPKIMFFDEPTSGLDSESSYQVMSYLKDLARQGRCIISVVHQPSSDLLELFDDIYVVAEGQCLYKGPLEDLTTAFADVGLICPQYFNRADFVIKMASKSCNEREKVQLLKDRMKAAPIENGYNNNKQDGNLEPKMVDRNDETSQYAISQWRQFAILTHRTFLGTIRNFTLTVLRFIGHILYGVIIGTVYYQIGNDGAKVISNVSYFMMILLFIVFANSMTVVLTFPLEMAVFIREYKSNCYSVGAYFFSKIVADFPLMIGGVICFHFIAYYMTGQVDETYRMLIFLSMCLLAGWYAQIYGMLGGCLFPIDVSPFIVPITLMPAVLFSGYFIRYDELFDVFKPLTYISPVRFALEGVSLASYGFGRKDLNCNEIFCYYRKARKILEMLDMEKSSIWVDVGGLAFIIIGLHIVVYVSLRFKVR